MSLIENDRRRLVVLFLDKQSEPVKIGRLADAIASVETDTPMHLIRAEERKSAYTALYQNHLEKLDNADVIEYEKRPGIIYPTDTVFVLAEIIRCLMKICSVTPITQ